ncbi:hypothetical protein BGZ60DRAFT_522978 [Tricladium varicosporioides]|nr:hypothetical protein BGZ60DRAFT_522978 [Hymenoscyphus varicosporioides]
MYSVLRQPSEPEIHNSTWDKSNNITTIRERIETDFTIPPIRHHEGLGNNGSTGSFDIGKYVTWGIAMRTPVIMITWAVAGCIFSVGHHFYYDRLDGSIAGTPNQQNWALRFGTAFSFLTIALLKASCDAAYKQYIWTLFKRKSYSLDTLDKLFALTTDIFAFVSWELISKAKLAVFLALTSWLMALAGITPPATLSVGPGFRNQTIVTSLASINWNAKGFTNILGYNGHTSSEVRQISSSSAQSMSIIPITPPNGNSTFYTQFYGPTVQCSPANSSQIPIFDEYAFKMWNTSYTMASKAKFEAGLGSNSWNVLANATARTSPWYDAPLMNVFSAFSPYAGDRFWFGANIFSSLTPSGPGSTIDENNNWSPGINSTLISNAMPQWRNPAWKRTPSSTANSLALFIVQQIFIQTSTDSIVCSMRNASFSVRHEFVNGVQTVAEYTITDSKPFWVPSQSGDFQSLTDPVTNVTPSTDYWRPYYSYMSVFQAFTALLNGNISTTLMDIVALDNPKGKFLFDGNVTVNTENSKILQHGLSACDDFAHGYWDGDNAIGLGPFGPVPWRKSFNATFKDNSASGSFSNISNNLFTKPAFMCRNRTLIHAIEDLANNITISMLSSSNLVSQNAQTVPVTYFTAQNIYLYDAKNLVISYSIAALFTLFVLTIGFLSLKFNGVAHSTSFSAIIATTRNAELDAVSKGHSLGALPAGLQGVRLRFGELVGNGGMKEGMAVGEGVSASGREGSGHIGFGKVENVVPLRRGGRYW